jgi:RHS repeat-associated protein
MNRFTYQLANYSRELCFYPGGMEEPSRKYASANQYRYGFNGKEKENDPLQYDYGFRIYDTRLVRFKSVDPLIKSYPFFSSYQFTGNNPIKFIDYDGAEPVASKQDLQNVRLTNGIDKGNIISGNYDPNDKLHIVDVEKVFDPIKKQSFFIHQENNTSYYWNSAENSLKIHRRADGAVESNGKWDKYETYEQQQTRLGRESTQILGSFFAGSIAAISSIPVVTVAAPTITTATVAYGTEAATASSSSRVISAGVNTLFQYIQNAPEYGFGTQNLRNINISSIGLSLLNPGAIATNAVGSNFGKVSFARQGSESIGGNNFDLKSAIMGSAISYGGGKISEALGLKAKVYGGMNKSQSQTVGEVLSSAVSTPVNNIVDQSQKKNP